jgi:hypothetical protein
MMMCKKINCKFLFPPLFFLACDYAKPFTNAVISSFGFSQRKITESAKNKQLKNKQQHSAQL